MYAADCFNHRIRQIDLKTKSVSTIAGDGVGMGHKTTGKGVTLYHPRKLVFDRSRSATPESVLFITAANGLHRLDVETKQLTTCPLSGNKLSPSGLDMTPSGHLIVSCLETYSIYLYDPRTSKQELLAGAGDASGGGGHWDRGGFADGPGSIARFNDPTSVVVVHSEQRAFIADNYNNRVRRMTLPAYLFVTGAQQ